MTSADSSNRSNPVGKRVIMPGLNTSYVLDTIMCPNGLRPLNMDAFRKNDVLQPLRVVASSLRQGKMETISFGSHEADFLNESNESLAPQGISTVTADGSTRNFAISQEVGPNARNCKEMVLDRLGKVC